MAHSHAELRGIAQRIRARLVEMSHAAEAPHLGSALSCVDLLVAVYWTALRINPTDPGADDRDRFILSKGHAATALYATLARRGFFPEELLDSYNCDGSPLAEHPSLNCVPGVEASTGSLGHGLSLAAGMALAQRLRKRPSRFFVLLSDGECNEGSTWEGALFAATHRLGRLTVLVDYNKWQATGRSNEVMALHPLVGKWKAFGWDAREVDGHDLSTLPGLLVDVPEDGARPRALIAHTTKGKGVSFMEGDNNWHYRIPTADEVRAARAELGVA
jgi:transketolase